ncbi:MAG: S49 family peptidase [Burkholderiales bacterium]|nr:S49 family peptidase [Burkholderiales bacterium]
MTLIDLITSPWAITPDKLHEIREIYATHMRGEKIDIDAVEARLGRPLSSDQQEYTVHSGGVAVLELEGVMAPKANLFMRISGGISTQLAQRQLESAMADARVRSILLVLDSPGGSVFGMPELGAFIREASAEKPIVTISPGTLASAAYWIGSAANAVYITGATVHVGSIGVVMAHDFTPRRDGGTTSEISAGRYKRIASDTAPLTEEGRVHLQERVDYLYTVFVDTVASQRGVSADEVLERMADGRTFVGQQAIDAGLVDGVSTIDALIDQLATDPAAFSKRRKAVFAAAALPSPSAGAAPKDKPQTREKEIVMPEDDKQPLTRASFEQDHAPLFAQLKAEFTTLGATQERDRIQAVLAVGAGLPGHEKLLTTLAYDGKTTAAEASVQVLGAERAARAAAAQAHADDAPAAAAPSAAPADKSEKTKQQKVEEAQAYAKEKGIPLVAALKELGYA